MPRSPKGYSRTLTKIEMLYALHIEKHMMELARAEYQLSPRYIARVFQICSMWNLFGDLIWVCHKHLSDAHQLIIVALTQIGVERRWQGGHGIALIRFWREGSPSSRRAIILSMLSLLSASPPLPCPPPNTALPSILTCLASRAHSLK